jgi:hypothetical protein
MTRKQSLDELGRALSAETLDACPEMAFRILYGLPAHIQLGFAQATMERYMPVFRARQPVAARLEPALMDPSDWVARNGRAIPELDATNPADSAFHFCFDAILLGAAFPDDPFTVTSSSAAAIDHAITAARLNVWMATDPPAVELWALQAAPPERTFLTNVASRAVALQEWGALWAILDSPLVLSEPDPPDEQVGAALARWIDLSHLISVPR